MAVFAVAMRLGVERVTAGSRLLNGATLTSHSYRLGRTLVDAGPTKGCAAVVPHLRRHEVTDVCLTHHHEDHVGAAPGLAAAGVRVMAPEASLAPLRAPGRIPAYRRRVWGQPVPVAATPYGKAVQTDDAAFEVVPTPGHSPDHVALLDTRRGFLFAGDAYLGLRSALRSDERLDGMMAGWRRMIECDARALFPGHGGIVTDVRGTLEQALSHHEGLRRRAWAARDRGRTVGQVARDVLGREGAIRYLSGGEFSKQNLARELLMSPPA